MLELAPQMLQMRVACQPRLHDALDRRARNAQDNGEHWPRYWDAQSFTLPTRLDGTRSVRPSVNVVTGLGTRMVSFSLAGSAVAGASFSSSFSSLTSPSSCCAGVGPGVVGPGVSSLRRVPCRVGFQLWSRGRVGRYSPFIKGNAPNISHTNARAMYPKVRICPHLASSHRNAHMALHLHSPSLASCCAET